MRSLIIVDGNKTFDIDRCRIVSTCDDPEEGAIGQVLYDGPLRESIHTLHKKRVRLYNLLSAVMGLYGDEINVVSLKEAIKEALLDDRKLST